MEGAFQRREAVDEVLYSGVPGLEAALQRVEAVGGETLQPPAEVPDVVASALFRDPEGSVIGLVRDTGTVAG